jgi:hypothetical protein
LPGPIRARYRALRRKHPEWTREHAYAVAVNAVKYSSATGDSKLPGKQNQRKSKVAAHTRAARKWERMKAGSGGKKNLSIDTALIGDIDLSTTKDDKKKKGAEVVKLKVNDKSKTASDKKSGSSTKEDDKSGKMGAASDGNRSPESLKKTIKAYMKNKSKMTPEQRKKVEARIKSSKQQLGQKGKM